MPAIVREHPVLATFELLLLAVFLRTLYLGLRAEWNLRVLEKPRPSLSRGPVEWQDFSLAWIVIMAYAGPLVTLASLPTRTAALLHTLNALTAFYLVFISRQGRNRVLRFAAYVRKLEE